MNFETRMKIEAIQQAAGITATKRIMRKLAKANRRRKANSQESYGYLQSLRAQKRRDARHTHLVRGLYAGLDYADMEQSVREGNEPSTAAMDFIARRFGRNLGVDAASRFIGGV